MLTSSHDSPLDIQTLNITFETNKNPCDFQRFITNHEMYINLPRVFSLRNPEVANVSIDVFSAVFAPPHSSDWMGSITVAISVWHWSSNQGPFFLTSKLECRANLPKQTRAINTQHRFITAVFSCRLFPPPLSTRRLNNVFVGPGSRDGWLS